jgi:ubiquinone/menaquinone biosynthesis C-methylase UbiE
MTDSYYKSRYVWDKNRSIVWKEIVKYLSSFISSDSTVLDIGAGYCDFINNVKAKNKIALDYSPDFSKFANDDVKTVQSKVTDMSVIHDKSVDVVFASNLLEHLSDEELSQTLLEIKRVLKKDGRLILMQPNYRLSYKTYFDDPTHKKVFSDESLRAFLLSFGFEIELAKPRFLPFSLRSRPSIIPVIPLIIRAYIHSPFKPFAGQMLFVSKIK